jgi:hypothetical protein
MNCGVGMREVPQPGERKGLTSTGSDLDRKYWVALALYAILAALAWFTVGDGAVHVFGRPVELRLLPLIIIGGMALRTVLARHAEKIRRGGDGGGGKTPRSL